MDEGINGACGRLKIDMSWRDVAEAVLTHLIVARGARAFLNRKWRPAPSRLCSLPGSVIIHQSHASSVDEWLVDFPDAGFALVAHGDEEVRVRVAARTDAAAHAIMELFRETMPETVPLTASVPVVFWTAAEHGPQSFTRNLDAPTWPAIEKNYAAPTATALAPLFVNGWRPHGGRLLLWRGKPGTGKTHAVRALMQAWRTWCSFHVLLDPERFFGTEPEYMIRVLWECGDDDDDDTPAAPAGSKWRLLILEDAGELISVDAADRTGQGLSRLLNLCDGLFGLALDVMVLVTTNEDIGRLHPAVSRPGRCLSDLEFQAFDAIAAHRWLSEHAATVGESDSSAATLAELYARVDGRMKKSPYGAVGLLESS